ncbi:MAG: hypothetical protein WAT39_10095 [Planctomycetota bacterium]
MTVLVSLALLTALLPQDPPAPTPNPTPTPSAPTPEPPQNGKPAVLTAPEQASLRTRLAEYLLDDATYDRASGKERDKAGKERDKSKGKFEDEWRKAEKKGVLGSMIDLRAVFENCFLVKQPSISLGQLRAEAIKEEQLNYSFFLPKTYKAATPHRTLLLVPGTIAADKPSDWVKPVDWFSATWDKSTLSGDTIVQLPVIPSGLEMDPIPDYSREGAEDEENRRIKTVFRTFGEVMSTYNVDRARVFLDCGRGACGFALRLMTLFPDRFGGAVLRLPSEVDDIRLGSLTGVPVLLLRTAATAAVVDALKKRLEEVSPGKITALDVADEYPHKGANAQIEEWLKDKRRNMLPPRVVIEPNHDRYNRAYWVDIDTADSLLSAAPDKKPRLEVQADRKTNRITVKAVGVEQFKLFLNDDLVDLDKEFTVVINDKAVTEKRTRTFRDLREGLVGRYDWDCLFPVVFTTTVPK